MIQLSARKSFEGWRTNKMFERPNGQGGLESNPRTYIENKDVKYYQHTSHIGVWQAVLCRRGELLCPIKLP